MSIKIVAPYCHKQAAWSYLARIRDDIGNYSFPDGGPNIKWEIYKYVMQVALDGFFHNNY
jgi:hypothetical protein